MLCPAHDDSRPSLSIDPSPGTVLFHCKAGCTQEAVLAALGLRPGDLYDVERGPGSAPMNIVARYPYQDADGRPLYEVIRLDPKEFKFRRPAVECPDPDKPADWFWSRDETPLVPYRLPELMQAVASGRTVYVVEGEGKADKLREFGLVATTNPFGALGWQAAWAEEYLTGAEVVLLPDNDEPGYRRVERIVTQLRDVAHSVHVIELPGLPPAGDVIDWCRAGNTGTDFLALDWGEPYVGPGLSFRPFSTPLSAPGTPATEGEAEPGRVLMEGPGNPAETEPVSWGKSDMMIFGTGLSMPEKLLYLFLAGRQGKQGYETFGQQYVADSLGWKRDTVAKAARGLRDHGLIEVVQEGTKKARYIVIHNRPWGIVNPAVNLPPAPKRYRRKGCNPYGTAREMAEVVALSGQRNDLARMVDQADRTPDAHPLGTAEVSCA